MKKTAILLLLALATGLQSQARDGFAIVIDQKSYTEAKAEVDAYAKSVEQLHGLHVYTVIDRWGIPDSIRAILKRMHEQKQDPIIGTVLIGDIPVAMIRDGQHMTSAFKMNQIQPRKESSVPSDRYYDDFGLQFKDLGHDDDAPYFYYSVTASSAQRLEPDIYSGRIRPTDVNGTSRYQKLRDYLRKLVIEKNKQRSLRKMFFFSGHGYISESKVARMDEKQGWKEHFPHLNGRTDAISYMDHSDHHPVKENLMNELMRSDLDFAILHHHGYWDTEYLNGISPIYTVQQAKDFITRNLREHLYSTKQRGHDYKKMEQDFKERFDVPDSWMKGAYDDAQALKDSALDAQEDLHLEDFAQYGYQPNCPVVVIDACFCGSFHKEDCIADEYIFQPGSTVVCVANSVNVLQDKWSDRLMGLISEGGCIGDVARYSTYLESHIIGDPTFRFKPVSDAAIDIDHVINENKVSSWRKLLKSSLPDYQSLAIEHLCRLKAITSAELKKIYEQSPYGIVRMMALTKLSKFNDDNFIETIKLASQDAYELVQRQAIRYIHDSGDERLIPSLIKICISNNTSDRVNFDAKTALDVMSGDKLVKEFAQQFDDPSVHYIHKDTVRSIILRTIERGTRGAVKEIEEMTDTATTKKAIKFTIRAQRNNLVHAKVPFFIDYVEHGTTDPELQTMILEALGWHANSYQAKNIADAALRISKDSKYAPEVRNEALKTYNRITQ